MREGGREAGREGEKEGRTSLLDTGGGGGGVAEFSIGAEGSCGWVYA